MNTGFDILQARSLSEQIEIDTFEVKFQLKLPPIFKLFATTFLLGEKNLIRQQYYESKSENYYDCKTYSFVFQSENIGFSHFNEIDFAFEVFGSNGLSDLVYKNSYFPFAVSDGNGLYLGTKGKEIDEIFWDRADGSSPIKISNNVFEFIRGIQIGNVNEEYLYGGIKHSDLYKNLDDTIWNIR
jgi:hypothetical protein